MSLRVAMFSFHRTQESPFDASSGVTINRDGSITCDDTFKAAEDVYVAGDIALFPLWLNDGEPARVEHWVRSSRV